MSRPVGDPTHPYGYWQRFAVRATAKPATAQQIAAATGEQLTRVKFALFNARKAGRVQYRDGLWHRTSTPVLTSAEPSE